MLLAADADLVRRDSGLPGLPILLDPDAFVSALGAFIHEADLSTASITYVRYKPGVSCLVGYQVQADAGSVDVYAKAVRPGNREKLHKALQQASVVGLLGPGHIVLEDPAIAVSIFPNDNRLPGLIPLADGASRPRLLKKLFPARPDLLDGTVRGLRYKPERRYVAQLLTPGGARAVLRVYTGAGFETARRSAKYFTSRGPLRVARRLGRSTRYRIVAYDWLPGQLLSDMISGARLEADPVATAGAALAELHAQHPKHLPLLTRQVEAGTLLRVASGVGFLSPHLAGRARELALQLAARIANEPLVNRPIHGDFYAKQVVLSNRAVGILDLDEAVRGDPAVDLGMFIADLERDVLSGKLPPDRVAPLKGALLEGYRMATRDPIPARIELYTAAGLLRLMPHPFREREPAWPERTEALLERAEAIVRTASARRFGPRLA